MWFTTSIHFNYLKITMNFTSTRKWIKSYINMNEQSVKQCWPSIHIMKALSMLFLIINCCSCFDKESRSTSYIKLRNHLLSLDKEYGKGIVF